MKEMKITIVSPEVYSEEDFREPSKWYVVGATSDRYYFHCAERSKAQEESDRQFGKGKYTIRTNKMSKGSGEISCRGSLNSKSYSGQKLVQIRNSQGRGL